VHQLIAAVSALLVSACGVSPLPAWGPLAVVADETGAEGLATGTIRVTEDCVHLDVAGSRDFLLIWSARKTRWNPDLSAVAVVNSDGGEFSFRDGMLASVVGGDLSAGTDLTPEEWASSTSWVAPPDSKCLLPDRWYVNDVFPA
jgi:hypothetical protein